MSMAPLAGFRFVEFAGIGPAPFAAMLLADLGAQIIRIDRPGGADPWTRDVIRRGRRTLALDLKDPAAKAGLLPLIAKADGLIEGFRPGVMERLGLGPAELLAVNPRLAYGRMTGWGQDGPYAQNAGHDITYLAISGALAAIGPKERPIPPLNLVGDMGGGALYLALGLLAAILAARRDGQGRVVDCAISDCAASLMAMTCDLAAQGRWTLGREQNLLDGAAPFYRCYPCSDGEFLAVGALEPAFFAQFCGKIGLDPVPPEAERLAPEHWPALAEKIASRLLTKARDEWAVIFSTGDACAAPVLRLEEAPAHPHNKARGSFVTLDGVTQPARAPRFSGLDATPAGLEEDFPDLAAAYMAWDADR